MKMCCENIEKRLLIYINEVIVILSFLFMSVGVWIMCHGNLTTKLHLPDVLDVKQAFAIIFTMCGLMSICFHGIGIWAALREITSLLTMYTWWMIISLPESVILMLMLYNMMDIKKLHDLQILFEHYNHNDKDNDTAVNFIQETFKCCGYNGPEDYRTPNFQGYPASCCNSSENCFIPYYTQGCLYTLEDLVQNWMTMGTVTVVISGVLDIICIVLAFRLASKITKKSTSATLYRKM